jgi:mono/diheme cytochrome c family protein
MNVTRGSALAAVSFWIAALGIAEPDAAAPRAQTPAAAVADAEGARGVIARYCTTCHNERTKTGGLALDGLDLTRVADHADVWEAVVRKLRTGVMPPAGMPRPDRAAASSLASWLEAELDIAARAPRPGRPLLRRLNRAEYANVVQDLLSVDVDVSSLLPADDSAFGFDNIGDLLTVSPALLERYLDAADRVSALAVGDPATALGSETYHVRGDQSQSQHLDGLPLGTVGGLAVRHTFPLDAEYEFKLTLFRTNLEAIRGLEHTHQIEIAVDGERVFLGEIGGSAESGQTGTITERSDATDARLKARAPVKAGPRVVTAAFIRKMAENTNRLRPFLRSNSGTYDSTGRPHIETLTVTGPFNATGPGDTPSRRRVFTCRPVLPAEEEPCARRILSTLARRAYRRPLTETDLSRLLAFYRDGRGKGTFETGIQLALRRLLASPTFVFRIEDDPAGLAAGTPYPVSNIELASRLSFFLWSSMPDDTLLDVAATGRLRQPEVLEGQVRRMLADPRSDAFVENFAGQWLHIRNLRNIAPNSDEFPDFDNDLRDAFRRETELFFGSVMREDRNVLELMRADYTFVNERLAKHYGIPNVYGSRFRRVTLADEARRGLLGKGSILLATSHADRTAPVLRGKWIMENLLGSPPPPPPGAVPPLEPQPGARPKTMRERMEIHRASPACAGCHRTMDALGFTMENFNAVGAWRTREAGAPIDASGTITDGTPVNGVVELRNALLEQPEIFVATLTEKLLTYGLGRGLQHYDMPVVRAIVRDAAQKDYRFSSLIVGIVSSAPFQMREKAGT